jgi:nucleoside-diphosphate-sugar epimerase
MDWCVRNGVEKYVLASSSSVYGGHYHAELREGDWPRPISPYAASKAAAEDIARVYHDLYKLDITVLRYFTVYGPAGRPDMAVFRFIKWLVEGEPIIVYGSGEQARDFTYVDDIARGTIAALQPMGYRVINLGSGRPFSLLELIEKLEGIVGKKANIKFMPPSPADVPVTHADITLAGELLNWQPAVDIDDGLQRTVAWYMENREWAKELV